MSDPIEYRFKISPFTPETIPMARLAEYMADLAILLGESASVHFVKLERGSTVLVQTIDSEAVPKVENRVTLARKGQGAIEPIEAAKRLNRRLREDDGSGVLTRQTAEIFQFPGREAPVQATYDDIVQEDAIDGVVVRLGGTQDQVPVTLQSNPGVYSRCLASRAKARELAKHLFGGQIRVFGTGRWSRNEEGRWILDRFTVSDFTVLDETPLVTLVEELRAIPGSEWPMIKDPWAELYRLRNGTDEQH